MTGEGGLPKMSPFLQPFSGKFLPVLLLKTPYFGQYNLIMATPAQLNNFPGLSHFTASGFDIVYHYSRAKAGNTTYSVISGIQRISTSGWLTSRSLSAFFLLSRKLCCAAASFSSFSTRIYCSILVPSCVHIT